jgi:hypothetical protein
MVRLIRGVTTSDRVFPTRSQAERMLAEALQDEPGWCDTLRVERIDLVTGTAN